MSHDAQTTEVTFIVPDTQLLSSLWYHDGSGARAVTGMPEGLPESWQITRVSVYQRIVTITMVRVLEES